MENPPKVSEAMAFDTVGGFSIVTRKSHGLIGQSLNSAMAPPMCQKMTWVPPMVSVVNFPSLGQPLRVPSSHKRLMVFAGFDPQT
jgi:hypothetical protein